MGRHSKPRSEHKAVPAAAVMTLAAAGGAQFLAPQGALAVPPAAGNAAVPVARAEAVRGPLAVLTRPAAPRSPAYTIVSGDTLSGIAGRLCRQVADWPALWHANHYITDPNLIYPGKSLAIACKMLAGWGTVVAAHSDEPDSDADDPAASPPKSDPPPPLSAPPVPSGSPQQIAMGMLGSYGWDSGQMGCLNPLWNQESGWNVYATNPGSGAYGIPQSLPADKMASAGPDWRTDATTQIRWGLGYIRGTYGSPCGAWAHEQADGWY